MAGPLHRRAVTARRVICLILLPLLVVFAGCRRAQPPDRPATKPSAREAALTPDQRQQNLESFDYVWNTIREKHWDATLGGLDWEAVRQELRPRVEEARSMAQARRAMQQMIDRLEQSHFAIIPASVYSDMEGEPDGKDAPAPATGQAAPKKRGDGVLGVDVRVLDGKVIVTGVDPQLGAAAAGVKPGWEVLSVDGRETEPLVRKLRENLPDNSMRRTTLSAVAGKLLTGPIGQPAKITFRDGRGKKVHKTIAYTRPSGKKANFGHLPTMYLDFESRRLPPNVGYIAFKPFLDPETVMAQFAEAISEFRNADGIILDLRGNPGGLGGMAMGIGSFFVSRPNQQLGTMRARTGSLHFVLNPRHDAYRGPLAVLVDEMSMSTAEILAGGLQDLGRARVFGTRTPGAALPSIVEMLPNGDGFQYAFADYTTTGGKTLEGAGVTPDHPVELDRSSLLAGRDPVIDAAVGWIESQKQD